MGDQGVDEAVEDNPISDDTNELRPSWESFVERVVADVRANLGSPVADKVADVLADHRGEAESALRGTRATDDEHVAAEADRREAAELVRDAVNNWRVARTEAETYAQGVREEADREAEATARATATARAAAEAELDRVRSEIAALRRHVDDIEAPLDAREAELVAWEVQLTERAEILGIDISTALPSAPASDGGDRGHRSGWSSPTAPETGVGRRGWGRRTRSDEGNRGPSR